MTERTDFYRIEKYVYRSYTVSRFDINTERKDKYNYYMEVPTLANIKSAKKRILVINTKTERNKAIKTKVKTYIKKVEAAVAAGDKTAANESLTACISEINKAASKGIYHKNTAARKISRLTKAVNNVA